MRPEGTDDPVTEIVIPPGVLVMVTPDPAVSPLSEKPDPLPISN
jgi:hypothetical protein